MAGVVMEVSSSGTNGPLVEEILTLHWKKEKEQELRLLHVVPCAALDNNYPGLSV